MDEYQLVARLFEEFTSTYEGDRVRSEYRLSAGPIADIVILDEENEPFLIGEAKTDSTVETQWEVFDTFRSYYNEPNAPFLGYFTEDIRYIHKYVSTPGSIIPISVGELPSSETDLDTRRGFKSFTELLFCFEQTKRVCKEKVGKKASIEDFLKELQRIVVAEKNNMEIFAWQDKFPDQVRETDKQIQDRFPYYDQLTDLDQSRIIHGVLNGYSLNKTDNSIIQEFVSQLPSLFDDKSAHGTPVASAEYLSEIIDVSKEDNVLDPAIGWGNVLRELYKNTPEASYKGIEINSNIAQTASALNTITDSKIPIQVSDGIKAACENEKLQSAFDHVILDPPIGKRLSTEEVPEQLNEWEGSNIEEIFLYAALKYLNDDGLLTAIIPVGLLSNQNSKYLREELIENYHIKKIIEVDSGSFYPSVRSDLAVIQIRNKDSKRIEPTEFLVLDQSDQTELKNFEPEIKKRFELSLSEVSQKTLIPSKIAAKQDVKERLQNRYSQFKSLDSLASELRRGIRVPTEKLSSEGRLQYLKISNATGETDKQQFVGETDVENLTTADSSDLLISAAGTINVAYVPEQKIVPHSNWIIVRFESERLARLYQGFFCTNLGTEYLESLATGTTIPHLSISTLIDIDVPHFTDQSSTERIVSDLAKIEELNQGRVSKHTATKIDRIFEEGK